MSLEIMAEKGLSDGHNLKWGKYPLREGEAEALERPTGSYEMTLRLYENSRASLGTRPTASWYLTEEQFREVYGAITDGVSFEKARIFFAGLQDTVSPEDFSSFLETL